MQNSVLLAAHDRAIRNRLCDLLERLGFEVTVVWRSDTALTLLKGRSLGGPKRQFSLVVTERDMPRTPSVSFIDDLRSTPTLSCIPVLVVTPKITDADLVIARRFRNCRYSLQHASNDTLCSDISLLSARA